MCIKFRFGAKYKHIYLCAPGRLPAQRLRTSGRSRKSLRVWRTCSTEATGPWRIPLPCVSAAVRDARGCFPSVPLVLGDFHHHRSVTTKHWESQSVIQSSKDQINTLKQMLMKCFICLFLQMKISEKDTLQNLTGRNISDYLVKTYAQIIGKR